ncbi:hypothetical protein QTO34_010031 [Cnephaeus nilssonii]|uniref:Uncharacterized protein n=1 Tax=Cnephaeus nilssonii TaxID=3371016 RepID=A0AA40LFM6_CNENI|nr:hypothetical protein QTO34_010031 [Eptesicus nilssonii]
MWKICIQQNDLITHQLIHMEEKPHECIECGKAFTTNSGLCLSKKTYRREALRRHTNSYGHSHQKLQILLNEDLEPVGSQNSDFQK